MIILRLTLLNGFSFSQTKPQASLQVPTRILEFPLSIAENNKNLVKT